MSNKKESLGLENVNVKCEGHFKKQVNEKLVSIFLVK